MERALIDRVIKHEGLVLRPYKDTVGKLTIGVGRNLDDNGITEEEARYLLDNDLNRCHRECLNAFTFYADMDFIRQGVVLEMCFNIGLARLKGFKKMLAACEIKDYQLAAREMLDSRWAKQVGKRATTLADIMKRGV